MSKLVIALVLAILTAIGWGIKWYLSPERKAAAERKRKQAGHNANASKDGRKIGDWFRKQRRR
ncbi:MAG TPA: hypothetical protein ENH94_00345 [Phycisphaerales bacterium]|nr:hypothetical protein [Phycisphaerales bacterium]